MTAEPDQPRSTPGATPPDAGARTAPRKNGVRGAIALMALAAALMWASSRLTWYTVSSSDGLTEPRTDHLNGSVWFGALTPLALVLLAAIAAVLATRGWLRRLIGVLVALIAAVTAVPAFALFTGSGDLPGRAMALAELPGRAGFTSGYSSALGPALSFVAALAAFAAGVLLARMPREGTQLSGKYDNPSARREAATEQVENQRTADKPDGQLSERVLWDALDAGTDPTDDGPKPGARATDSRGGKAD
ncbi:TIGR02234 family membrane protein [Nocardia sp. XZ_19_385]|uniref:TIGR02234 family membrane protein n=1 Tax=Nocardia sp. XZ_19_385 TaxID=2769488 RepID=UPI00188F8025|nr:TIGR02234 family membrane protein [Nocardia sp. XZ_19_385]